MEKLKEFEIDKEIQQKIKDALPADAELAIHNLSIVFCYLLDVLEIPKLDRTVYVDSFENANGYRITIERVGVQKANIEIKG